MCGFATALRSPMPGGLGTLDLIICSCHSHVHVLMCIMFKIIASASTMASTPGRGRFYMYVVMKQNMVEKKA